MNIGGVTTTNTVMLAPLAGFTDAGFRALCANCGAGMTVTEMVSAKGMCYGNKGTDALLYKTVEENPVAVQLFGSDPNFMYIAAHDERLAKFDVIDINMGCPVRKIVSNGDGSALMENPSLIEEIVTAVREGSGKPVTVKLRSGVRTGEVVAPECAEAAVRGGACAVTVHPRFRDQMYGGVADHSVTAQVARTVSVPVIASGDIVDAESFWRVKRQSRAAGFMIGRGALGRPWIFEVLAEADKFDLARVFDEHDNLTEEARAYAVEITKSAKDKFDVANAIRAHVTILSHILPERAVANSMKLHLCHYAKNTPNAKAVRLAITSIDGYDAIEKIIKEYFE